MLKKIVIVIIILIALPLSGLAIFLSLGKAELRKQQQAYLDAGYSLDLADFITPEIPDDVNAAIAYQPIFAFLKTLTDEENALLGEKDKLNDPNLVTLLAKCDATITALHAAADRPQCRWEIGTGPRIESLRNPHLLNIHYAGKLLYSSALTRSTKSLRDNQNRDISIIRDIEAVLKLGVLLSMNPDSISQLIAARLFRFGTDVYEEIFTDRSAPPNRVLEILATVNHRENFSRYLQTDIFWYEEAVAKRPIMTVEDWGYGVPPMTWYQMLALDWDRAFFYRAIREALADAQKPIYEAGPMLEAPEYAYTSHMFMPANSHAAMTLAIRQTRIEMLKTAEQLRTYKTEHGKYPAPGTLTMPIDPANGKPIEYRLVDDGFVLIGAVGIENRDEVTWTWEK